jgi:hypothetical protein
VFVLGGEDDKVLDVQAYQELARCEGGGACLFIHAEFTGSSVGLHVGIRTDMALHFDHVVQLVGFSQSQKGLKYGSTGINQSMLHLQL